MPEATTEVELTKEQKMSKARNTAFAKLREAHAEEYNQYVSEEAAKRGLAWSPKLTEEQRAAKEIEELLQRHPNLREQLVSGGAPPVDAASVADDADDYRPTGS